MKIRKKLAAMLLSVITVFSLLPAGAMAATNSFGTPAQIVANDGSSSPVTPPATVGTFTNGTLNIQKTDSASSFAIYELYSMKADGNAYDYTVVNPKFTGILPSDASTISTYNAQQLSGLTSKLRNVISGNSSTHVVYGDTSKGDAVAPTVTPPAKASYLKDKSNADGTTSKVYQATYSSLALGYYLVIETSTDNGMTASKDFLVSVPMVSSGAWINTVTALCKDSPVSTDKTIAASMTDFNTKDLTGATRKIGETVPYRLDADVPKYDDNVNISDIHFILNDHMSKGLSYDTTSVKIYANGNQANDITQYFSIVPTVNADKSTDLVMTCTNFSAISGYSNISAFYSATLNSDAVIGQAGNPNEYYLTYTQSPGVYKDTNHHKAYVYTFGLEILKLDTKDSNLKLAGAEFSLLGSDDQTPVTVNNTAVTGTTKADGTLDFTGIKEGTYYVRETKAPNGYGLIGYDIKVEITAVTANSIPTGDFTCTYYDKAGTPQTASYTTSGSAPNLLKVLATFNVLDQAGFILPGTGGIGTTIFFVSGIAILLLGGCMALVYTKKRKKTGGHFQH